MRLSGFPHCVEDGLGILGVAEDLVAQFAGITGARNHQGRAVERADPAHGEAEPGQFLQRRLGRSSPDELLQDVPRLRPLHRDIAKLVGRVPNPGLHALALGDLAHMDARQIVAADPTEIVLTQPVNRAVVDHPAMLVADGGVDDLSDAELLHVARHAHLHQRLGIGAGNLVFAQGRQVHDDGFVAAGPIFGDGAVVVELVWQPVAVVFHEVAGVPGEAGMEARFLRLLDGAVSGHAEPHGSLEVFLGGIGADLNVGRVPAIGRIDIAGAGG